MDRHEAIVESVRTRIRPIYMSAMTSVFGMAPLVIMPGAGSELYRGLGAVVLGGLLVSTIFTVLLVPTVFAIFVDAKQAVTNLMRRLLGRRPAEAVPQAAPQPGTTAGAD